MNKSIEDLMNMNDDDLMGVITVPSGSGEASDEVDSTDTDASTDAADTAAVEAQGDTNDDDSAKDEDDATGDSDTAGDGDEADAAGDAADESASGADGGAAGDKAGESKDKPKVKADDTAKAGEGADKAGAADKSGADEKPKELDYKALYEQVMKPFKANGKEIKLENADEAIKLMQMGANYTKKMQALQPNLKILRMLENHNLMDENKLTQLIDMSKGDKTAIAKFVKDSGIDPLDIDTDTAVDYKPGNHTVSDSEISFEAIVEEVSSEEHGQELIIQMNHQWDQASKKEIFKEPELIRALATQKSSGIYDQIATEVEKQKMLGHPQIAKMPFIHAYRAVGQAMQQAGLLKPKGVEPPAATQPAPREVARATAPVRKTVTNGDKAKAASPSAGGAKKAQQVFNPLAMSDEEFLKSMENRV